MPAFAALCVFVLAATLCALASPVKAMADEPYIAHTIGSDGQPVYYTDANAAKSAGYSGATVYMDADWDLGSGSLDIADSKSLTIDMCGHTITSANRNATLYINEYATLKIISSAEAKEYSFTGYAPNGSECERKDLAIWTSGLITNTKPQGSYSSGVHVEGHASVKLENVAVVGCPNHGIITKGKQGSVSLNNAKVCYNRTLAAGLANEGGGVCMAEGSTLSMNASSVDNNYGGRGGGVFAEKSTMVDLENGSTISNNSAGVGGGAYFNRTYFTIKSDDRTGRVSGNTSFTSSEKGSDSSQSGGGIHVDASNGDNKSTIEGLYITDNFSLYDGGGIELDQRWTTVKDCTITGNHADYDAGGVYINGGNNSIVNCTITGNYCNGIGKNQEGGGVFVSCHYDIKMSGKCVVKNNTRGRGTGNADDVFLSTLSGGGAKAYITGSLDKGSLVGVRTGITEDRRVAKSFSCPTKDGLFADMDGYYISYGTDEGGDAWQRHATREFAVSVDGKQVGTYKQGSTVSVSASPGSDKAFKCWNADESSVDVFDDKTKWNQGLSFTMPQHDVQLVGTYITRTRDVRVSLEKPQPGTRLSSKATLMWVDGEGVARSMNVTAAWCEKGGDGSLTPASGAAKAGTTYVARFSAAQDVEDERAFAFDIGASDVKVSLTGGELVQLGAAEVSVDEQGTLSVTTNDFKTDGDTVTKVEPVSVSFPAGMSKEEFMKEFPRSTTGLASSGFVVDVPLKWPQDFSGLFDDNDELMIPEPNPKQLTLELDEPEGATLPDDLKSVACHLTVVDAPVDVAEPTVSPDGGTYSAAKQPDLFSKDGKLKLAASCTTEGAEVKYSLDRMVDGEWEEVCSGQSFGSGIALAAPDEAGAQTNYRLQVWAEKDGSSSSVRTLCYTVENAERPQVKTVTVRYTDTAIEGQHGKKADETCEVEQGSPLIIVAPNRKGYVFEKWLDSAGAELDTSTVLAIDDVEDGMTITAVYNPVVSEFNVGFDAPVAHEALAASGTVQAKAGSSDKYFDIESYFVGEDGKASITWSPDGDDEGKAEHMRNYTAAMSLKGDAAESGVKYVLSPKIKVCFNGAQIKGGGAYIAQAADGTKSLCVAFPNTGPLENPVFDHDLGTVELTYEQALSYQAGQDAGKKESWSLPKEVEATCKCGCIVPLDITWEAVEGFDKSSSNAQELKVKGKVSFPGYVDPDDGEGGLVSDEVTAIVKVAAAEQGGGSDQGDGQDDGQGDSDQGQATDGSNGSDAPVNEAADAVASPADDSTVPATGDSPLAPAVAAAALAAFAAVVAIAALRRRRN